MTWILYGAYGYTGRLILDAALRRGLRPVVAGRDAAQTSELAGRHGLERRVFGLEDPDGIASGIEGAELVLNAAGPYSATFAPVAEACLVAGAHYLDITGEIPVLERAFALGERARESGVVIVCGVGFDVVPTDCLAAEVAGKLEAPSRLDLAFVSSGGPSRGTARTMLERVAQRGKIRRDGEIVDVPLGAVTRLIPFADRSREAVAIPWGDVSTAWRSTGVPDVRVFTTVPRGVRLAVRLGRPLLKLAPVRRALRAVVDRRVRGPDREELETGGARVWCEVRNDVGEVATGELVTPNPYALTAEAAAEAVARLLDGAAPRRGALTPSQAFGRDFVFELPGVERIVG